MNERIVCPRCQRGNPPENRFCGACGAALASSSGLPTARIEYSPATTARTWPAKLGPAGKVLAVGLATLAAEAGLSWLRRWVDQTNQQPLAAAKGPTGALVPEYLITQSLEEVSVWLQEGGGARRRSLTRRVFVLRPTTKQ